MLGAAGKLLRTRAWGLKRVPFRSRLRESLSTIQADNLALGEKLQRLVSPSARDPLSSLCLPLLPASQPSQRAS